MVALITGLKIALNLEDLSLRKSASISSLGFANQRVSSGAMNGSRPLKRQRTTGPIITKYPPPPYQQAPASLQRGFTHPPVGHHAFPPSHGPPTPASAQSQSYNGWNSQQTPWPTQTAQQVKQHWIPPAIPNPVSSHGSQHGSPISINGNSQSRNFQYSQPAPSPSQASPIRKTSYGSVEPSPVRAPGSFDSSMYPQSRTRDQAAFLNEIKASDANGEEVEPWLEELQVLDFVDGKPASGPVGMSLNSSQQFVDIAKHANSIASCKSCCPTITIQCS